VFFVTAGMILASQQTLR